MLFVTVPGDMHCDYPLVLYLVARKLLKEEKTLLLSRARESQVHKTCPLTIHLKQNLAAKVDLVAHP